MNVSALKAGLILKILIFSSSFLGPSVPRVIKGGGLAPPPPPPPPTPPLQGGPPPPRPGRRAAPAPPRLLKTPRPRRDRVQTRRPRTPGPPRWPFRPTHRCRSAPRSGQHWRPQSR